jgi:glycosyltransferase EpsE
MNKKISVIMSVYNAQDYLEIAINSIINQAYQNWEFIICDDASTDNSWEIIKNYKIKFPEKFIIFQNTKNMRLAYSLNECLKKTTGELVARMDADDISHSSRFRYQVEYLEQNPLVSMVGTEMIKFNDFGKKRIQLPSFPSPKMLLKKVTFFHPTIMTYKFVYDNLGGYVVKKRTSVGQDYDLWFRFFAAGYSGRNISEPLYLYRKNYRKSIKNKSSVITRYFIFELDMIRTKFIGIHKLKLNKVNYLFVLFLHTYTFLKFLINTLSIGNKK